jgi:hypothetical protein
MTSPERIDGLIRAVRYVVGHDVAGAFVECGVWRGGSIMAAALMVQALGRSDRDLYLFDTFEGMPEPGKPDRTREGDSAAVEFTKLRSAESNGSDWCRASLEEVRANLGSTKYPADRVHLVMGKVEETIPSSAPPRIAILRLDTDWYESTLHELEHLFPRLVSGGVLIIDDYGWWLGARRAVDEYFARSRERILLSRIDESGLIGVKCGNGASA